MIKGMMKIYSKPALMLLVCTLVTLGAMGARKDAYDRSRIFWDIDTKQTLFDIGNYARMIQLQDGRLMVAAESSGINVRYSSDGGKTWTTRELIASNPALVSECVPDLIQLADGTIIVGYNPRPHQPYSDDRRFGIRCRRSTDNGATWSNEIFIFDAQCTFADGCWEPSFLELPSGELQCYFANENDFTSSTEQCISLCRSYDKGLTWSAPERVSYRQWTRDGMPVPILTPDGSEIVVIIEDNGWPGSSGFIATTVRTTLEDNWASGYVSGNSSRRNKIFATEPPARHAAGAPYLRVLPWGETVASYQGNDNRSTGDMDYMTMSVLVGDPQARNFKGMTQPFNVPDTQHSLWNSVAVVDTGTVVALGSIGQTGSAGNRVDMIKGYPRKNLIAKRGTPNLNGTTAGDDWTFEKGYQIILGQENNTRRTMDFLYDDQYLYFTARCVDRDIIADVADNDGVFLYLDMKNACDVYPRNGMYQFFFDVNGVVTMKHGADLDGYEAGKWIANDAADYAGVKCEVTKGTSYYELEVAIPWSVIGESQAPTSRMMRADVMVRNRRASSVDYATIVDTETTNAKCNSWAWMGFVLIGGDSGVEATGADHAINLACPGNGKVKISAGKDMSDVALYSFDGMLIDRKKADGKECTVDAGNRAGGIVKVTFAYGSAVSRKVMFAQ
ncbi:MAG: exo-alpha-sialidase [Muribaculaceae bacterium]